MDGSCYEVNGLADRVSGLRGNYTTYDACYLALAEALDAPLYTCDTLPDPKHPGVMELRSADRLNHARSRHSILVGSSAR